MVKVNLKYTILLPANFSKLRSLFEQAYKSSPSLVFIDEIDVLAPRRDEVCKF